MLDRLSFRTAGESHGPAVVAVLEGIPRGLELDLERINAMLRRRQGGAGRGGRQRIEDDTVEILGGLRRGATIGSPLCLVVRNRDDSIDRMPEPSRPRPGHADLSGCYRYLDTDIRGNLERASARETAGRVAAGAVAVQLLEAVGSSVFGFVRSVADVRLDDALPGPLRRGDLPRLIEQRDRTRLYTLDASTDAAMLERVQEAGRQKDTVGGVVEVQVLDPLPGIGSCLQWHERLDARLAAAVMSIPAFKGVEIGLGFGCADRFGSAVHDAILPLAGGGAGGQSGDSVGALPRDHNHAGGLEGGMANGQPIVVRGAMKPISTLRQPLASVDLATGEASEAGYERSDLCAVSAASVVGEAMVALVAADASLRLAGGETVGEFRARVAERRAACRDLSSGA